MPVTLVKTVVVFTAVSNGNKKQMMAEQHCYYETLTPPPTSPPRSPLFQNEGASQVFLEDREEVVETKYAPNPKRKVLVHGHRGFTPTAKKQIFDETISSSSSSKNKVRRTLRITKSFPFF